MPCPGAESVHSVFEKRGYGIKDIAGSVEAPEEFGIGEFADLLDENTLFLMSGGGYFDGRWDSPVCSPDCGNEAGEEKGSQNRPLSVSPSALSSTNRKACFYGRF